MPYAAQALLPLVALGGGADAAAGAVGVPLTLTLGGGAPAAAGASLALTLGGAPTEAAAARALAPLLAHLRARRDAPALARALCAAGALE